MKLVNIIKMMKDKFVIFINFTKQSDSSSAAIDLREGFSLLEMVIAIGIFSVAIWAATGIVINATDLQAKASELRNLQDNVRFAVEYMSKELRTGQNVTTSACSAPPFCERVSFTNDRGQSIMYCVRNFILIRSIIGNCDSNPDDETKNIHLTSDDILVDFIFFRVVGNAPGPSDGQTMTTLTMKAASLPGKTKAQTDLNLQTTVTQRLREVQ